MSRCPAKALGALLVFSLAACGKAPPGGSADYVALGSSFAAGPGVAARDPGSPLLCGRSSGNYAHRVARALHMTLRDATCSSATSANILSERQAGQPPQIESVGPGTRLVTVTVGGNDVNYLGSLSAQSCLNARGRVPWLWRPVVCKASAIDVEQAFARLPASLTQVVRGIHARAPGARIVLLDYNTVLPAQGTCPAIAPLDARQMRTGLQLGLRLSQVIAAVARQEHVLTVSAAQATAGHDLCAKDPWVNGFAFSTIPLIWGPFAYHPNDKGMQAVAGAVLAALRQKAPPQ